MKHYSKKNLANHISKDTNISYIISQRLSNSIEQYQCCVRFTYCGKERNVTSGWHDRLKDCEYDAAELAMDDINIIY